MVKKLKENYILYLCLAFICLFQLFWIMQFQFYVSSDDFGYIADAAYFAGYNWNNYTGDMTPYYPTGFSVIPAFFFRITSNPVIVYRLLLVYIVLLQIVSYILVYKILIRFLGQGHRAAAVGAFAYSISSFSPQSGLYYMSEIPYALSVLMILYFLLASVDEDRKKKKIYSVFCGAVLAYSYSIHSRFLVSVVVVFLIIVLYGFKYKKQILHIGFFLLSFVVILILTCCWVKSVQNVLYKPLENIRSAALTGNDPFTRLPFLKNYIQKFLQVENWKQFILRLFSLMGSYTLLTGGMVWTVFMSGIHTLKREIKENLQNRYLFIIAVFGLVSFFGMNCLIAMTGVMNIQQTKWLTAIRYSRPYIGILFILFFAILWEKRIDKKKLWEGIILSLCSLLVVIQYVGPVYENTPHNYVDAVGWMRYYFFYVFQQNINSIEFFLVATKIAILIGAVLYMALYFNKSKTAILILIGYSLLHITSENQWNLIKESRVNYDMVDGSIAFMEKYGDRIKIPIYFTQKGSYAGKLRFGLFSYDMHYILYAENLYNIDYFDALLFSDQKNLFEDNQQSRPQVCFEIGQSEYIYTSNTEIIEMLNGEYKIIGLESER